MPRNLAALLQSEFNFDVLIAEPGPQWPALIETRVIGADPLPHGGAVNDNTAIGSAALLQVLKQKLVIFASGMSRIGDLEAGTFA
jgi:hypothetical protein